MQHSNLNRRLLVVYGIPQYHFYEGLRSAATKVLSNFKLVMEGNQVRRSESCYRLATIPRSAVSVMLNGSGLNQLG